MVNVANEYDLLKIQFNLGMGKSPVALHCVELCTRISFGESMLGTVGMVRRSCD